MLTTKGVCVLRELRDLHTFGKYYKIAFLKLLNQIKKEFIINKIENKKKFIYENIPEYIQVIP